MTQLEVGTLVRVTRRWPGQANGWGGTMDQQVGRIFKVRSNYTRVDPRCVSNDGEYYYTLDYTDGPANGNPNPYLWSIRSLDIQRPSADPDGFYWMPADPRDNPAAGQPAAQAASPAPPAIAHRVQTSPSDPNMKTQFVTLRIGQPGREQTMLSASVSNYAMGCCGVGQLHGFGGSAVVGNAGIKDLTAAMAAEWLAKVMMATAYSSYVPMQAVFCFTDAQKPYVTIKFLTEFLGAKPLWEGKNRAHSPFSKLNMHLVDLDCPDLIHVNDGVKGQAGVNFTANTGAALDPKGRFKEWIDGLK